MGAVEVALSQRLSCSDVLLGGGLWSGAGVMHLLLLCVCLSSEGP